MEVNKAIKDYIVNLNIVEGKSKNTISSYTRDLLEQLYSNLEIETETNPKNNKSLQKFKNKYIKDKFND